MVYDLPPGPYQLPVRPFLRGEDPHLLEHIVFKQPGQLVTVLFICFDPAATFSGDAGWRGDNTFNAISGKSVVQFKAARAGFVNNADVVAFKPG